LGVSRPFIIGDGSFNPNNRIPNPEFRPRRLGEGGAGGMGGPGMGMGGPGMGMGGPGMGMGGPGMGMGGPGMGGLGPGGVTGSGGRGADQPAVDENGNPEWFAAPKYSFQLQFIWRERPLHARLEAKRLAAEAAAREEAEREAESATGEDLAFSS